MNQELPPPNPEEVPPMRGSLQVVIMVGVVMLFLALPVALLVYGGMIMKPAIWGPENGPVVDENDEALADLRKALEQAAERTLGAGEDFVDEGKTVVALWAGDPDELRQLGAAVEAYCAEQGRGAFQVEKTDFLVRYLSSLPPSSVEDLQNISSLPETQVPRGEGVEAEAQGSSMEDELTEIVIRLRTPAAP